MAYKMKGHSLPGIKQRKKTTDMSKLRSKQARSSKGISEFEHFKDPKSQGDEPIVEGTWGGKKKDPKKPKSKIGMKQWYKEEEEETKRINP